MYHLNDNCHHHHQAVIIVIKLSSGELNMALRTIQDWTSWLSEFPFSEEVINTYAEAFTEEEMTEADLSQFSPEVLTQLKVTKLGHRTKILQKAKSTESSLSTRVIKSDIKLPHITMNSSSSKFRKFLIDWEIYKSGTQVSGSQINKLLYSSCDEALQNNIINGLHNFLEVPEKDLITYIKNSATQQSNPAVYRLSFQKINQLDHQTIDEYIAILREKAVDCDFRCPSPSCKFDYTEFAVKDRLIQGLVDKKFRQMY